MVVPFQSSLSWVHLGSQRKISGWALATPVGTMPVLGPGFHLLQTWLLLSLKLMTGWWKTSVFLYPPLLSSFYQSSHQINILKITKSLTSQSTKSLLSLCKSHPILWLRTSASPISLSPWQLSSQNIYAKCSQSPEKKDYHYEEFLVFLLQYHLFVNR